MITAPLHAMALVQLPALAILAPLLAAPVCGLLRGRMLPWLLTLLASIGAFLVSLALLSTVLDSGPVDYAMGGWEPPVGIAFRVDAMNAFVLTIISGMSTATLLYARRSLEAEISAHDHPLFYTAYLLCLTGLLGITATGDAFNFFVFLEISSLATYTLVAMGASRDRRALTAAFRYLVMGTIGATFYLIGVGFLYIITGTLNMADLAERLQGQQHTTAVPVAFAFIVVGLGLKAAVMPLHAWLPNAYAYAPTAITVFLAATATKAAVYGIMRFLFTVFGLEFSFEANVLPYIFMPLALIAMFAASAVAVWQQDVKRMLAWSSVAQLGYILLGLSLVQFSDAGLVGSIVHLLNHALMKTACFMAVGAFLFRCGDVTVAGLAGIGRHMPWTMGAFVIGGMSLIGVPGTVGFISKWYLIRAALEAGLWPIAILIVLSSLIAVAYIWRIVEVAWFHEPQRARIRMVEAPLEMLVPMWIVAGLCIWFGIDASGTLAAAQAAADALLGGLR
jgi:multicomponent Na+:H+ antiporter subunit D